MEVEDKGCAPDEGCLTVEHVHLSPTLAAEIEFGRVVLEFGKVVGALERAWVTRKANAKNDLHNHDLHTS